jgi:hypothetical protein
LREKYKKIPHNSYSNNSNNSNTTATDSDIETPSTTTTTTCNNTNNKHNRNKHNSNQQHSSLLVDEHSLLIHDATHHSSISSGYHSIGIVDLIDDSVLYPHGHHHHHNNNNNNNNNNNGIELSSLNSNNNTSDNNNNNNHNKSSSRSTSHPLEQQVQEELAQEEVLERAEEEEEEEITVTIAQQLREIWETVQLQAVWRPMTFVYLFNLFQVPNVAWQSYLQLCLHFPAWILGTTVMLGSFMTFAGVLGYKYFFFKSSWRRIYVRTVMLTAFFSLLQLILIFQYNVKYLHLSNYLFSMGDDVISAYISGIQFLPLCIMYMRLCPDGAEGSSYAMLTTFGNIALVCASNLGNMLANIWDVSNATMRAQDVSGLWKLNTLTSSLSVLPLCLLFLLPRDAEEQDELAKSKAKSPVAGAIFLVVLFGSLLWTSVTAILRISA